AARAMADKGAREIYAVCTHAVLSGEALERIENSPIKKVVITDSVANDKRQLSDKYVVVSCADLFGEAIGNARSPHCLIVNPQIIRIRTHSNRRKPEGT
ncbi:MAG: hypothetical protein ACE5GA_05675, partial [Candidatus Zixiibacteriota bacterium]